MLLSWFLAAAPGRSAAQPGFKPDRFAAIVVEADSGRVVFSRRADAVRFPASLTKVMTLYIAFDDIEAGRLSLDERIRVSRRAAAQPPSKAWLKAGSTLTVREAIDLIAVKSANDAATALAEHISGSEAAFAKRMNLKARKIGMRRTHFMNASGLPNSRQETTARDLATLSRSLIKRHPDDYAVFNQTSIRFHGRKIRGHNALITRRDVDGIKTGYTRASGFNLITSSERGERRVIAVVLGGDTAAIRDAYMRRLLQRTFAKPAVEATAQQADAATTDAPDGVWWVQVGAFRSAKQAWAQLEQVARRHPGSFGEAPRGVDRPGRLHKARFNVFSEQAARKSCALLKSDGEPCFWFRSTSAPGGADQRLSSASAKPPPPAG